MILRTANGSLMKVTKEEGQRMLQEQPFDYFFEPDGCEICVKESWTTCEVRGVRMCHSCFLEKYEGNEDEWDRWVDAEMKRIEEKKKEALNETK